MGVPKQVAEMEAECDKELNEVVEVKPTEKSTEQKAAEKQTEIADNKSNQSNVADGVLSSLDEIVEAIGVPNGKKLSEEEILKKEKFINTWQGRINRDHDDWKRKQKSYEAKIAELEASIEGLTEKLNNVRIGDAPARNDATEDELFAEIRKEYSEEDYSDDDLKRFIGVIRRVGGANQSALKKIQQRFDEMDAERAERAKSAAKAEADGFVAKLNEEFPGFRDLDAKNDPRWIQFLATDVGGVMEGTSYQDIATDALKTLNYRKFASVVREFAKRSGIVFSPNGIPADASVVGQIRPNGVAASEREQKKAPPRVVPAAEVEAFRRAAFAHKAEERYGLTRDQVMEQLRFYEDAEADGRVQ